MSPVDFNKCQCCMSLSLIYSHVDLKKIFLSHVTIFLDAMSHVNKLNVACRMKRQYRPVEFKGQGPFSFPPNPDPSHAPSRPPTHIKLTSSRPPAPGKGHWWGAVQIPPPLDRVQKGLFTRPICIKQVTAIKSGNRRESGTSSKAHVFVAPESVRTNGTALGCLLPNLARYCQEWMDRAVL